ncbi:hypothetical protein JCM10213_000890 [Rhodosporidiobolus nylandii]
MFSSLLGTLVGAVGSSTSSSGTSTPSFPPSPPSESAAPVSTTSPISETSSAPSSTLSAPPAVAPEPSSASPPCLSPLVSPAASAPCLSSATRDLEDLALDSDPRFEAESPYFKRLLARGGHHPNRIREIKRRALQDEPPREPAPWECCGGGCALECVVTIWWEEEKTWRDLHPDWKSIKARLKEEEEDRIRAAEEEAALSGGEPVVEIGVEEAEKTASWVRRFRR